MNTNIIKVVIQYVILRMPAVPGSQAVQILTSQNFGT